VHDHHEHWDGGGYPRGLAGENISLGGRILCAADAFDALTSLRSYRGALTPEATIDYLAAHSGGLIDPSVFDVLATVVRRGRALVFIDDV
jgi:putative two-component system response regulator